MPDDDCDETSQLNESNISASLDEISVTHDKPSNEMADESYQQVDEHIRDGGTGIDETSAPQKVSKKINLQASRSDKVQAKAVAKKKEKCLLLSERKTKLCV